MLVCGISARARRTLSVAPTEAATATETATAGLVYNTLVDDPASALDFLYADVGAIPTEYDVLEVASAADVVDAGSVLVAAIVEDLAAAVDAPSIATASYTLETATAIDTPDATVTAVAATWSVSDLLAMTLSNGNLTATSTATTAGVRATVGRSSGKYYWEATCISWGGTGTEIGLATSSAALAGGGVAGQAVMTKSLGGLNGSIYINGSYSGSTIAAGVISNNTIGIAVDLTGGLIWFRNAPTGNWNGSSTANPATGAGGISLGALAGQTLYPLFAALAVTEDDTANFGGSAFSGAVPSGFTSGWV